MDKPEFNSFADEYYAQHARNIAASGEAPEYFSEYKIADTVALASQFNVPVQRILDFAGIGNSVPWFSRHFPSELLQRSLGLRLLSSLLRVDWAAARPEIPGWRSLRIAPSRLLLTLSGRQGQYDTKIVSRPDNMALVRKVLREHPNVVDGVCIRASSSLMSKRKA
jgi:hypothetical protein